MSIEPGIGDYLLRPACHENKVKLYLMSLDPRIDGNGKRAFFESCGFSRYRPDELIGELVLHGSRTRVEDAYVDQWGEHWECTGPLRCPDGRTPKVRTVWIRRPGDECPTLVTAVPD